MTAFARRSVKGPPTFNRLQLRVHRRLEPEGSQSHLSTPLFLTYPPAPKEGLIPWRKLAVEVTPERVRVLWEGKPIPEGEISVDRLNALVNNTYKQIARGNPGAPFALPPRGPLGLFVSRGKASFRDVAVEPIR